MYMYHKMVDSLQSILGYYYKHREMNSNEWNSEWQVKKIYNTFKKEKQTLIKKWKFYATKISFVLSQLIIGCKPSYKCIKDLNKCTLWSFCVSVTSPWKPQTPTSDKHTDRQTRPMTACP